MRETSAHGRGRMGAGEVACDAKVGPLVAVLRLVLSASSVYCSQIPMYCSYHHTGTGTGTGVLLLGCHVQRQTVACIMGLPKTDAEVGAVRPVSRVSVGSGLHGDQ